MVTSKAWYTTGKKSCPFSTESACPVVLELSSLIRVHFRHEGENDVLGQVYTTALLVKKKSHFMYQCQMAVGIFL